jgi:hypothetical protein
MTETRENDSKLGPLAVDGDGLEQLIGASKPLQKLWRLHGGGPPVRRWAQGKSARARYVVEEVRAWLLQLPVEWPLPDDSQLRPKAKVRRRTAS